MRATWNTDEPRTESTGQQITAEHRGVPHSPATPAWNIADRNVKEEPTEDKNNDSGVSPGHYTSNSASPRSRRSSSTANGSLSPGSATSQDSNVMQYEYSPQNMLFKASDGSPVNFDIGNPVAGIARKTGYGESTSGEIKKTERMQTNQTIENASSPIRPDSKDGESMQCPVCPFTTIHRMQFNEHLITHCSPAKCDTGDLSKAVYGNNASSMSEDGTMNSPSPGEKSEHEFDETDEPGLRVPRVNSQGKVKTFRCKQCDFIAVTKLEFWEHSRGHIKADKLLTCPKCPFVTEYKHHLEYHLRNHFGSKPFKCDKCPYSCVNKSMLNSHLKSHSNVYQYRCANCAYATKYCHSLKLHLRKYSHKPAMVLNPDGSPNPLPIIDIYGTRRGPKQKPAKTDQEVSVSVSVSHPLNPSTMMTSLPPRDLKPYSRDIFQPQINVPFAYGQIFNTVNHFLRFHENNNDNKNRVDATCRPSLPIYDPFAAAYRREASEGGGSPDLKKSSRDFFNNDPTVPQPSQLCLPVLDDGPRPLAIVPPPPPPPSPSLPLPLTVRLADDDPSKTNASPLDLSKSDATTRSKVNNVTNDSPRASGTSRRKGRAFKLDKLIVEHDSDDDDDDDDDDAAATAPAPATAADNDDDNNDNDNVDVDGNGDNDEEADEDDADEDDDDEDDDDDDDDVVVSKQPVLSSSTSSTNDAVRNGANNGSEAAVASCEYTCQFCDIAFGNLIMYTMHMSYHAYHNPYVCNMCGQECTDKVSFFLHISHKSHA